MVKYLISCILSLLITAAFAQVDSLRRLESDTLVALQTDSLLKKRAENIKKVAKPKTGVLKQALYLESVASANKPEVVFIRSVVPGLGQITNDQFYKAPVVWVAATVGVGTIRYWGSRFKGYRDIIVAADAAGESSSTFLPARGLFDGGLNIGFNLNEDAVPVTISNTQFNTVIERFRRYRDLSVIGFSVGYLIVGVEAYVAAHLKNFDVSDDISLQLKPMVQPNFAYGSTLGLTVQLNFN